MTTVVGWSEVLIAGFVAAPPTILAFATLLKTRHVEEHAERAADQATKVNEAVNNVDDDHTIREQVQFIAETVTTQSTVLEDQTSKLDAQQKQLNRVTGMSQEALDRVGGIEVQVAELAVQMPLPATRRKK